METISQFLLEYKMVWITLHAVAAGIGIGAATVTDVMFFNSLRDGKIVPWENKVFRLLTKTIWMILWIILISGLLLFLGDIETYSMSTKFIVKMTVVAALFLNGILLNRYLHPRMNQLNFQNKGSQAVKRIAFASGAVSIVSWYLAFILGMQKTIPVDTETGLLIYGFTLVFVVSISQLFCNHFQKKMIPKKRKKKTNSKKKPKIS